MKIKKQLLKSLPLLVLISTILVLHSCGGSEKEKKGQEKEAKQSKKRPEVLTEKEKSVYVDKGLKIAKSTGKVLKQNLQKAMKEGGVTHAIQFCNTAAYPLTDSLSQLHNAKVKRSAHKVRNPKNEPDELEQKVIQDYLNRKTQGLPLKPVVKSYENDSVAFHAPIMAQPLCLNCHGTVGETLDSTNYKIIREHYPEDKATGFQSGDLRGIWSIRMKKEG